MLIDCLMLVASIATFFGGKSAALSLTFDDGLRDQYELAWPVMKSLGLKGSFCLIGQRMDCPPANPDKATFSWAQAAEMSADGQEMTSHGWSHRNVTTLSPTELEAEIEKNDSAIAAHCGLRPVTYFYPGNRKSDAAVARCSAGRVGTRTFQTSLGSKRTLSWFRGYIDSLISRNQWGVTMTHGISRGYDCFTSPETFFAMLRYAASRRDSLWIAPLRDVAAYIQERDNTKMSCRRDGRTLYIDLESELSPSLFGHPLTIVFDSKPLSVTQNGRKLEVYMANGRWCVNCTSCSVVISKSRWRAALVAQAM